MNKSLNNLNKKCWACTHYRVSLSKLKMKPDLLKHLGCSISKVPVSWIPSWMPNCTQLYVLILHSKEVTRSNKEAIYIVVPSIICIMKICIVNICKDNILYHRSSKLNYCTFGPVLLSSTKISLCNYSSS